MSQKHQAILARDMIDMIRRYSNDEVVLAYLESFTSSMAEILEDKSVIDWYDLAGICDQRYYSLKQGNPIPLNVELLDEFERQIQLYLPKTND